MFLVDSYCLQSKVGEELSFSNRIFRLEISTFFRDNPPSALSGFSGGYNTSSVVSIQKKATRKQDGFFRCLIKRSQ